MAKLLHDGRELKMITVTPQLAKLWLSTANTRNRSLDRGRVGEYAKAMADGRWRLSNDCLSFSRDGVLLNGQHRLHAVATSGLTQVFAVLEGAEDDDQNVMDVGKARKAGQQLQIHGWKNGNIAAAVVRALLRWHGAQLQNYRPTVDEIAQFASRHAARLEISTDVAARVARRVPLSRAWVGAVCFTAYDLAVERPDQLPAEQVGEFFALLETGAEMPADHPVMVLRDRAIRYKANALSSRRVRQTEEEQLHDLVRTWNGFRKGERYSKLQPPREGITIDRLKLL